MKAEPLRRAAVSAARAVLAKAGVQHPRDVHPEAIAGMCGARIVYGRLETAVASLVRGNGGAIIQLDERSRGTARERFSTLHETAHLAMHAEADHLMLCTEDNAHRGGGEAQSLEIDANHFATEVSMHEPFAAPMCAAERPSVDDVEKLVGTFRASFSAAGIRFVQLSPAPCAIVFSVPARGGTGGVVKWAVESESFPGSIYRKQAVPMTSVAARVIGKRPGKDLGAREVPGGTWGTALPLLEHALPMGPEIGVMSWVTGAW